MVGRGWVCQFTNTLNLTILEYEFNYQRDNRFTQPNPHRFGLESLGRPVWANPISSPTCSILV